jgi:hypothetical protein
MTSPTNVVATVVSPGSANITWTPPESYPEGDYYYVVHSKSDNDVESVIGTSLPINSNVSSYTISGLKEGSIYSFIVGIVSVQGISPAPGVSSSIQV